MTVVNHYIFNTQRELNITSEYYKILALRHTLSNNYIY